MEPDVSLAVVTGGAGGIGNAVARRLLAAGSTVVMVDSNERALEEALSTSREHAGRIHARCLDVRDPQAVLRCAQDIETTVGPVDALVTCAGVTRSGPAETMTFQNWKLVLDVNLDGTFLCCQAFGKAMLARKHDLLHGRPGRLVRTGQLQRVEVGGHRAHQDARHRMGPQGRARQRDRAGTGEHADDGACARARAIGHVRRTHAACASGGADRNRRDRLLPALTRRFVHERRGGAG
jgi:NAD(P)-dependent dehydrogenase (short-subunit alcohol dehydrogenase family)